MLYPLTFRPIFKERLWGGRKLEQLFNKPLPPDLDIGESWEISDRPGDVSVIDNGSFAGKDLHWLLTEHGTELLGNTAPVGGRFPLLVKILDARERLSLQVHPPIEIANKLGGEPKTELWYIVDADPEAELYVGLRRGITRQVFERSLQTGTIEDGVHRVSVQRGDAMFLPSGRVHAIGSGLVLFEIQQNSDTTYRVFDWNRVDLNGKPRPLQPAESLASINFDDFEPSLVPRATTNDSRWRLLIEHSLFTVQIFKTDTNASIVLKKNQVQIVGVVEGSLRIDSKLLSFDLQKGQFSLIPFAVSAEIQIAPGSSFMLVQPGE
jgi:mannose-6-phosphate isomerase